MCSSPGLNPFRPHTGGQTGSAVLPWDVQSIRSFDLSHSLTTFLAASNVRCIYAAWSCHADDSDDQAV